MKDYKKLKHKNAELEEYRRKRKEKMRVGIPIKLPNEEEYTKYI